MNNAAVIVTYNRLELLKECIDCVLAQSLPFSYIIIVDNNSSDGTKEFLKTKEADGRFKIVFNDENVGGAGGFYQGIEKALEYNPDWLLIIDDDAMIEKDYAKFLVEKAESDEAINALAGSVRVNGVVDIGHRRGIGNKLLFSETPVDITEYLKESFVCDCATFCGFFIKGSVAKVIGLPKKEYFLWYDDTEYSLRLKDKGKITVVPKAVLNHKTVLPEEGESLLMRTSWRHYYGYRNRYDTAGIHLGKATQNMIAFEYHFLGFLSSFMALSKNEKKRAQGKFNKRMIRDALVDAKTGCLGKREEYQRKDS